MRHITPGRRFGWNAWIVQQCGAARSASPGGGKTKAAGLSGGGKRRIALRMRGLCIGQGAPMPPMITSCAEIASRVGNGGERQAMSDIASHPARCRPIDAAACASGHRAQISLRNHGPDRGINPYAASFWWRRRHPASRMRNVS